jgi:hypothetical protein
MKIAKVEVPVTKKWLGKAIAAELGNLKKGWLVVGRNRRVKRDSLGFEFQSRSMRASLKGFGWERVIN